MENFESQVLNQKENNVTAVDDKLQKVMIICSKGTIEDVYAALIMTNGAVMEGIKADLFFTFFGLDAITKSKMDKLHTSTVGNPAFMPKVPTLLLGMPGMEAFASFMMKKEMEKLDIPPVSEFLDMITAGGGRVFGCKLAADMFKLKKEDLYNDLTAIITVGELYEMAGGKGTQIIFV
jgi:peroxiredoxin family protein